jgi:S-adenosylmethionine-diacylglycerol 3-amino-3-carboxypropyl transferase
MINYSQCWEDTQVLLRALNVNAGDEVLSVTSGGCNSIAIMQNDVKHVYAIDKNAEQNFLLEIKLVAILNLKKDELEGFLGYQPAKNRFEIFNSFAFKLSPDACNYWLNNKDEINNGITHCGKFEKYILTFQRYILPLIHSSGTRHKLLTLTDQQQKRTFYDRKWNSVLWRTFFKIFFSRPVISHLGRSAEMYSQSTKDGVGNAFFNRIEKGFTQGMVFQNYYLSYLFFGRRNRFLPDYLSPMVNHKNINLSKITYVTAELLDFLLTLESDSIDKFNLSDVFESQHIYTTNALFHEIYRTAKPGARLIFWNNLVKRDVPTELNDFFIRDIRLEEELKAVDRIFFYDQFYIYTVKK